MKEYIIFKGWHYSIHWPKLYNGNKKEFIIKVKPNDSWRYNFNNIDQQDINKLWGIGFGNLLLGDHHKNSIRLGSYYNPVSENIQWFDYSYENFIRNYGFITLSNINELIEFPFKLKENSFIIGNKEVPYKYPEDRTGYYLFPYFGGNNPAPHDVKIKMEVK